MRPSSEVAAASPAAAGLEISEEHGSVKGGPAAASSDIARIAVDDYVVVRPGLWYPYWPLSASKYGIVVEEDKSPDLLPFKVRGVHHLHCPPFHIP